MRKIIDTGYVVLFNKNSAVVIDCDGNVKLVADQIEDLYYVRETNKKEYRSTLHNDIYV